MEDSLVSPPTLDFSVFKKRKDMNFGLDIKEAPKTASDAHRRKYKKAERIVNFLSSTMTPSSLPRKVEKTVKMRNKIGERPWSPDKNEAMSFSLVEDMDFYLEGSN